MDVTVMNRKNAVRYCNQKNPQATAMISISDPRMAYESEPYTSEENGVCDILRLCFSDADGKGLDVYGNPVEETDLMTDEDARRVAAFAYAHRDMLILVHCDAGVSRSAGVAAAILKYFTGDDSHIFTSSRHYPNMWCYRKTLNALYGLTAFDLPCGEFERSCVNAVARRESVAKMDYVTRLDAETGKLTKVWNDGGTENIPDASPKPKPRLLVFAGPNGSGKSTITKGLPLVGTYVNADEIKRISGCGDLEAAQEAETIRETLFGNRMDFTFETVLSTDRNLKLLEKAKSAGYEIGAVFVLTKDAQINVRRVRTRAEAGGHGVPEDKIISRYEKSLDNLSRLTGIADITRVVDNSKDRPCLIGEVRTGHVSIWENDVWSETDVRRLLETKL